MDEHGELLRGILNEVRAVGDRIAELNSEVSSRRPDNGDGHLATCLNELARDVRELTGVVHVWRDEHRLDRVELRERVQRLERRVGIER